MNLVHKSLLQWAGYDWIETGAGVTGRIGTLASAVL